MACEEGNPTMKPRDRVLTALSHRQPDRCPMYASFTPEFAARLKADLALNSDPLRSPFNGAAFELDRAVGNDMLLTFVGWANCYYQAGEAYTDEWGVGWRSAEYTTPFGVGHYTEIVGSPLADDQAIDAYRPPDPERPELYQDAEWVLKTFQDEYWIAGATVCTIFECAWALRGYERLLADFALNPDLADRILDIPYRYHLTAAKKLAQMGVDMIWIGDDVGMQTGMLMSPKHWRRFLKPLMANFIAELKAINPRIQVAYHSDGNVMAIVPDLVEIGLDILNPIQPACLDLAALKQRFGDRLCFWGSMDEQYTLPFGTPEQVRAEALERMATLGRDGGLILGPTHHVQLDTPLENFWAMVNTIQHK
jgi:uroporphyrinogen decarboxylase